jgi:hypothetical protein
MSTHKSKHTRMNTLAHMHEQTSTHKCMQACTLASSSSGPPDTALSGHAQQVPHPTHARVRARAYEPERSPPMRTNARAHARKHMHASTCTQAHANAYKLTHARTNAHTDSLARARTRTHTHKHTQASTHTHTHASTHINTHTHARASPQAQTNSTSHTPCARRATPCGSRGGAGARCLRLCVVRDAARAQRTQARARSWECGRAGGARGCVHVLIPSRARRGGQTRKHTRATTKSTAHTHSHARTQRMFARILKHTQPHNQRHTQA